jgi:hypothetical protein
MTADLFPITEALTTVETPKANTVATEPPPAAQAAPSPITLVLDKPRPFFPEPEPDWSELAPFPHPPAADAEPGWQLDRLNTVFGLNGGPVEITIRLSLPYALAEPLVEEGASRVEEMRQRIADRLIESKEHIAFQTAARRLNDLEKERDRLDQVLAGTDRQLAESALSPDELAQLSADEAETKTRRGMIERAIAHVQRARDDAARAIHQVATVIAAEERSHSLDAIANAEREAAGLFKVAQDQLAELVVTSAMGGAIRNPWWSQHAAGSAATELCGPPPPQPPPPPPEKPANPLAWLSNPPNAPPAVVGGMAR